MTPHLVTYHFFVDNTHCCVQYDCDLENLIDKCYTLKIYSGLFNPRNILQMAFPVYVVNDTVAIAALENYLKTKR